MNNIYLYQDSWSNLLTLIKYLITNKIRPLNIKSLDYSPTLFDNCINLNLENEHNIEKYWLNKTNNSVYKIIYYVYLSTNPNKELIIYYFLLNSLKYPHSILNQRNLKCVNQALKIANYTRHESHKFKGFLRFKETKNHYLYAQIEPENNILELLAYHFKNRLKKGDWNINDTKYKQICLYDKKNIYLLNNTQITNISLSNDELLMQDLWKSFFQNISIKERENKLRQMGFMPKKYWKNIIEMENRK